MAFAAALVGQSKQGRGRASQLPVLFMTCPKPTLKLFPLHIGSPANSWSIRCYEKGLTRVNQELLWGEGGSHLKEKYNPFLSLNLWCWAEESSVFEGLLATSCQPYPRLHSQQFCCHAPPLKNLWIFFEACSKPWSEVIRKEVFMSS